MSILGQASYRAPTAVRAQAAFDDLSSKRKVLTVRGRTSAVIAMIPIADETAEYVRKALVEHIPHQALLQVLHVSRDNPSRLLWTQLQQVLPNMVTMCLDAT